MTICYSKSGGDRFIKSVRNGAKLAHHLLAAYGWDISSVTKHQDYSGKSCPHRILDEIGFDAFLSLVSAQAITGVSGAVKRLCALGLVNESDSRALERADPPMQQLLIHGAKTILKKGKNSPDVEQALNRLGGAGLIHREDGRWWQRQVGRWEALLLAPGGRGMRLTIPAPNPKQKQFFEADSRYVAYGGARGGGKSWAVRTKATLMAAKYPGIRILLMRKTFPELRENHILPLLRDLYGIATYNDSKKVFSFKNGSRIKFGYCDAQTDVAQYQGQEYDVIFMDEATHFTEYQFNAIKSCLRGVNDFPKRFYLTCNPRRGRARLGQAAVYRPRLPAGGTGRGLYLYSRPGI